MINEARSKLSRLGMSLFYLYLLLVLTGCAGIVFGIITMIIDFAHIGSALSTPLWQVILLIMISGLMIKLFLRECFSLLGRNDFQKLPCFDETGEQIISSTVVPFIKK